MVSAAHSGPLFGGCITSSCPPTGKQVFLVESTSAQDPQLFWQEITCFQQKKKINHGLAWRINN